jgi:spermidine/putrescine transport system ATP-binding protein
MAAVNDVAPAPDLEDRVPVGTPGRIGGSVQLAGIGKAYGGLRVLQPTDLAVEGGEFLTILGPSGSGKTTILKIVGGFLPPSEGQLLLDGVDISQVPVARRPFNTVFQDYALFPHMTAEQNVGYGLMVRGRSRDEIKRRVGEVLGVVGLSDRAKSLPRNLSGGQKQRVALARAIICEPRVILLDEPLSALDAELRRQMQTFLKDLQRRIRTTFLFVTHDQEEAITMSDRVVVMNHGRIEQVGPPRALYYRPATEFVASFFGDNNIIDGRVVAAANGVSQVETPLGPMRLATPWAVQPGQPLRIALRPEHLHPGRGDAADGSIGSAVADIVDVDFVGALTHVRLRVGENQPLKMKIPTPQLAVDTRPGGALAIHWRHADAHALRPAES